MFNSELRHQGLWFNFSVFAVNFFINNCAKYNSSTHFELCKVNKSFIINLVTLNLIQVLLLIQWHSCSYSFPSQDKRRTYKHCHLLSVAINKLKRMLQNQHLSMSDCKIFQTIWTVGLREKICVRLKIDRTYFTRKQLVEVKNM